MDTKAFATRTENRQFLFPKIDGTHILGIRHGVFWSKMRA